MGDRGASSTRLTSLPRFSFRNCPIQGQCAAWGNSQIYPPGSPQAEESLRKAAAKVKGKRVREGRRLLKPSPEQPTDKNRLCGRSHILGPRCEGVTTFLPLPVPFSPKARGLQASCPPLCIYAHVDTSILPLQLASGAICDPAGPTQPTLDMKTTASWDLFPKVSHKPPLTQDVSTGRMWQRSSKRPLAGSHGSPALM